MCIKDELRVMEDSKSIGNCIEWNGFKCHVIKLMTEVLSLRTKSGHQVKRIRMLESQIESYKTGKDIDG